MQTHGQYSHVPAAGHSVDEYLETIYFLAFPIGEYTPHGAGSPPLASRVAEMLHVSRASAGEMLKRLEAEGLIVRGEHKEALSPRPDAPGPSASCASTASSSGSSPTSWVTPRTRRTSAPTSSAIRSTTRWSPGCTRSSG